MTYVMRLTIRLCLVVACAAHVVQANDKRKLIPDDLFRIEVLDDVRISSDGQTSAFVVQRPNTTVTSFGRPLLWGSDHADVWVASMEESKGRNITNGAKDGSGFWRPTWSPDGQALAMLSTRGGNIRLWVWQRSDGSLRPVSESGVTASLNSFLWVSNHELLFWTLPPEEQEITFSVDRKPGNRFARVVKDMAGRNACGERARKWNEGLLSRSIPFVVAVGRSRYGGDATDRKPF